jgi:acid phosphatase
MPFALSCEDTELMRKNPPLVHLSAVLAAAVVVAAGCAPAHRPGATTAGAQGAPPTPARPSLPASPTARQALLDVCKAARERPSPRTDPHEDLAAILWQQTAAEYRGNTTTVYRAAAGALKGLAEAARKGKPRKDPVVVFDLDETVFDNSRFQGRLLVEQRNYESPLWDCWVGQKQALRIAGAELLFRELVRQKVRGRFVTNRKCRARAGDADPCPQEAETLENLNALLADTGYVATADELLLSGEKNPKTGEVWEDEKQPRRDFISQTHAIVMLVGDDLGDFLEGVRKTTIAVRAQEWAKTNDRWGVRWFLLPNPSYGSWSTAVDQEATATPPRQRHEVVEAFPYPKE